MANDVIHELGAREAAARIGAGTLSSEALVLACLDRIAARDDAVGAWQYLDADLALEQARAADRGPPRGPLHGVPIGIKDIIDTVDMPTTLGSPLYEQRRTAWDASCVAAARAAGAVILGKTVTTEFAYFQPGRTRNPHDPRRTPGGSSSGSAAAVADAMVPLALGSQTAASVIRPASFCGVYGYKASYGELSLSGIRPFAHSLDTLGIFARSVADVALMRSVLLGEVESADAVPLAPPPRLGVCRTSQWTLTEPCTRDAVDRAADACRRAGAKVDDIELPAHFASLIDAQKAIMAYEAAQNYAFEATRHRQSLSDAFRALIDVGSRTSRDAYLDAKRAVAAAQIDIAPLLRGCGALIAPATIGEAPLADAGTGDPVMSRMWTALHLPSLAVPVAKGPNGLPVGIQLIAGSGADRELLRIGDWVGRALGAA